MSRPAYQVLADDLRRSIVDGDLRVGDRLPGEAVLCVQRGVSRSTVREAIRLLEAQQLVVTTRGTTGGSFVAEPVPERVGSQLGTSLDLMVAHESLTLEQILEAREVLEVPAIRLAAQRRTESHLAQLHACVAMGRDGNEQFHFLLFEAAGNPLLEIMIRPLFDVLRDRMARDQGEASYWAMVEHDHERILALIEAGDGDAAAEEMRHHLHNLSSLYRNIDRGGDTTRRPDPD